MHQLNDVLKRSIGLMVSRFQFRRGLSAGVRPVAKEAVGQGAAEALMEQGEQQGHLPSLVGEAVGVTAAVALKQSMGFELA